MHGHPSYTKSFAVLMIWLNELQSLYEDSPLLEELASGYSDQFLPQSAACQYTGNEQHPQQQRLKAVHDNVNSFANMCGDFLLVTTSSRAPTMCCSIPRTESKCSLYALVSIAQMPRAAPCKGDTCRSVSARGAMQQFCKLDVYMESIAQLSGREAEHLITALLQAQLETGSEKECHSAVAQMSRGSDNMSV